MLSLTDRAAMRFPDREGFHVTETLTDEITKMLQSAKANPVKIATQLNVPVGLVRFISNELPNPTTRFTRVSEDGWGRKEIRDFILSRKTAGYDWPIDDIEKIFTAREQYDAGTIEMAQGRDGDFIILYAIPRRKKVTRSYPYFLIEDTQSDEE